MVELFIRYTQFVSMIVSYLVLPVTGVYEDERHVLVLHGLTNVCVIMVSDDLLPRFLVSPLS